MFVELPSPEAKVRVMPPMYEPMKTERCKKCGKLLAKPKELIRILKPRKLTANVSNLNLKPTKAFPSLFFPRF